MTLYEHARRLHQQYPDTPLPFGGEPYPDDDWYWAQSQRSRMGGTRAHGADVAAVLDAHFGRPDADASDLVDAFRSISVPYGRSDDPDIAGAAMRADTRRVRETGRWLVQNATDRNAATVGLALLVRNGDDDDIPLIRTMGLLSPLFGRLPAEALARRHGGGDALLWLAGRVDGWGRVDAVETLCQNGVSAAARAWLLRHACDGDYLDGYVAGDVATVAHLHEVITTDQVDDDLIDHTGRLLAAMAGAQGRGKTLEGYPPAPAVLTAHAAHLARQTPTVHRYVDAVTIVDHLRRADEHPHSYVGRRREALVDGYFAVLRRTDWQDEVRANLDPASHVAGWLAGGVAARLGLDVLPEGAEG